MDLEQQQWWNDFQNDTNGIILDVRTPEEIEEGMIPEALHLDFYLGQDFINGLESLDKTKNYYVYCRSGNRSGQACLIMKQLGFDSTFNLVGGMNEWQGPVM
nr:rhodanese-like domain-containing protein [uncultured Flavobacterium sp.]